MGTAGAKKIFLKINLLVSLFSGILFLGIYVLFLVVSVFNLKLDISCFDLWLVKIFRLHLLIDDIQFNILSGLYPIDILVLIFTGVLCCGVALNLQKAGRVVAFFASGLSILGLVFYLATQLAGRSAFMVSIMLVSICFFQKNKFDMSIALCGIVSGSLLLAGDIGLGFSASTLVGYLFGLGLLMVISWFFMIYVKSKTWLREAEN